MKQVVLILLSCVLLANAADVNALYTATLAKMQSGERKQALQEFRDLAVKYGHHQLAGNFHYWAGEALMGLGRTEEAEVEYTIAMTIPNSNKARYAQFMLGQCYQKLGFADRAKAEWERFLRDYPNDELAPRVKAKLGEK